MKKSPHLLRSLVFLLVLLPLLFLPLPISSSLLTVGAGAPDLFGISLLLSFVIAGFACFQSGRTLVRKSYAPASGGNTEAFNVEPSRNFFMRYLGVTIACGYTVLVALISICLWGPSNSSDMFLFMLHLPSSGLAIAIMGPEVWPFLIPSFFIYLVYAIGMTLEFRRMRVPRAQWQGKAVFAAVFVLCAAVFMWRAIVLLNDPSYIEAQEMSPW